MEHTRKSETFAVLLRFLRRYWRIPAQLAGVMAMLLVLILALPFLPRFGGRVDAAPVVPTGGGGGAVQSMLSRGVGSPFEGPVAAVCVQVGQRVKKGDLLFKMDSLELRSQIETATAQVAAARANVAQAQALRRDHLGPLQLQIRQLRKQLAAERTVMVTVPTGLVEDDDSPAWGESGPTDESLEQVVASPPDPARLEALRSNLAASEALLGEEAREWNPVVVEANEQLAAASDGLSELQSKLKQAERKSPMDGVVTSLRARTGQWVPAGETVARVDNPEGYRVVVLVDKNTRESVVKGSIAPINISGTPDRGKLEKIVAGWDKQLYSYWLWIKPSHPERLKPGETVAVDLKPLATVAAGH